MSEITRRSIAIEVAARKLVEKMDEVFKSPEHTSVWTLHQLHFGPYKGPSYADELVALKKVLEV